MAWPASAIVAIPFVYHSLYVATHSAARSAARIAKCPQRNNPEFNTAFGIQFSTVGGNFADTRPASTVAITRIRFAAFSIGRH
jgi:hypothetical protein